MVSTTVTMMVTLTLVGKLMTLGRSMVEAGCQRTNPEWIDNDPSHRTAPEIRTVPGRPGQIRVSWNSSLLVAYSQCYDVLELRVRKVGNTSDDDDNHDDDYGDDPGKILCQLDQGKDGGGCEVLRSHVCHNASSRDNLEHLAFWISAVNTGHRDGDQVVRAPSETLVKAPSCDGTNENIEATFEKSKSCQARRPVWKSEALPDVQYEDHKPGIKKTTFRFSTDILEDWQCVKEFQLKLWATDESPRVYVTQTIEFQQGVDQGTEQREVEASLDLVKCKMYSYLLKAVKEDPVFSSTLKGKFSPGGCATVTPRPPSPSLRTRAPVASDPITEASSAEPSETEGTNEAPETDQRAETSSAEPSETEGTNEAPETDQPVEASSKEPSDTEGVNEAPETDQPDQGVDEVEASSAQENATKIDDQAGPGPADDDLGGEGVESPGHQEHGHKDHEHGETGTEGQVQVTFLPTSSSHGDDDEPVSGTSDESPKPDGDDEDDQDGDDADAKASPDSEVDMSMQGDQGNSSQPEGPDLTENGEPEASSGGSAEQNLTTSFKVTANGKFFGPANQDQDSSTDPNPGQSSANFTGPGEGDRNSSWRADRQYQLDQTQPKTQMSSRPTTGWPETAGSKSGQGPGTTPAMIFKTGVDEEKGEELDRDEEEQHYY